MSVLIRIAPNAGTTENYDEVLKRLEEAGKWPPEGMDYHVCFFADGKLRISEIWDSEEELKAFSEHLMPVLAEIGIESGDMERLEIHNIVKR